MKQRQKGGCPKRPSAGGPIGMLAAAAMMIVALSHSVRAAPVLRFAIDQDYYPGRESPHRAAEDFRLARRISVGIIRTGIGWDDTNPWPNAFRWGFWGKVMTLANRAGIEIRPYYAYTPGWAGPDYNSPPDNNADLARACGVLARVTAGKIPSIEIWNEPDNAAFWNGTARQFGGALDACSGAIHAVAGAPRVVLGGLTYPNSAWLAHTNTAPPASYDVTAFREYSETPWAPITVEQINTAADFSQGYDDLSQDGKIPVWMDEGGASTNARLGYSQRTQASWIRRTVASVIGHPGRPVSLFGLYQLRDLDPALSKPIGDKIAREFFLHTGIFTIDGRPKLAASTYGDLVRLFDRHRPDVQAGIAYTPTQGRTSRQFRLYGWRLETGKQIIMLWDRKSTSRGTIKLAQPGRHAFLHRIDGSIVEVGHFNGRELDVGNVQAAGMPLLYEIQQ